MQVRMKVALLLSAGKRLMNSKAVKKAIAAYTILFAERLFFQAK
jgi:hypothetical protein